MKAATAPLPYRILPSRFPSLAPEERSSSVLPFASSTGTTLVPVIPRARFSHAPSGWTGYPLLTIRTARDVLVNGVNEWLVKALL